MIRALAHLAERLQRDPTHALERDALAKIGSALGAEALRVVMQDPESADPVELARWGQPTRAPDLSARCLASGELCAGRGAVAVPIGADGGWFGCVQGWSKGRLSRDAMRVLAALLGPSVRAEQLRRIAAKDAEEPAPWHPTPRGRYRPDNIIGDTAQMRTVYDLIAQVADANTTVLIRGESGTGKELVAEAIHERSPRASRPLVRVNCAALPETLIESELFGHERGAFTGAVAQRKGRFELADGGTLFLDEIGELSIATQAKLLRVLQTRAFERVGGARTIETDVRVLAATHRDLEAMVAEGSFREDLYYRLNVYPVLVPALRARRTDIILLADHFVEVFNRQNHTEIHRISTPAIDMLMAYHWPGNVRELQSSIERACLLSQDGVIHSHLLPPSLQLARPNKVARGSLAHALDVVEYELVVDALKATRGNMSKAAEQLGVTERQMGLRAKKHGLNYKDFRPRR